MNKLLLSALGLAALGFVSCDDESYDDWTKTTEKQKYSQEAIIDLGMKATPSFSTVNLAEVEDDATFTIDVAYSLPANANVTHNIAVTKEDDPASATNFYAEADGAFSVSGSTIAISAAQLQTMVTNAFGKAPEAREFYVVDKMVYSIGEQIYTAYTVTSKLVVTPTAPVIESAYYFIGTSNGWSFANCNDDFKFSRADESISVYDDPVFTVKVPAPTKEVDGESVRDDNWFKIAPVSAVETENWDILLGCKEDGDKSLTGALVNVSGQALCMPASDGALFYEITINMMEYSYSIKPISFQEFIYTPGSHNGWDGTKGAIYSPNMDGNYSGYVALGGEWGWKVKDGDTWYGKGASEGTLDAAGGNNDEGSEVTVNFLQVNLVDLTFVKTPVASVGLAGGFNGWNEADAGTHMTVSISEAGEVSYTITLDMTAGEFKFVVNDGWGLNFGGTFDSLEQNGANLNIAEDGNYTITLYPSYDGNSNCTVKKN